MSVDLLSLDDNEIRALVAELGFPAFRAKQLRGWVVKGTPLSEMHNLPKEMKAALAKSGIPLYGAALRDDTLDAREADYSRAALAIGSEGRGLSDEALALCDQTIRIPMSERCESLNAAIAATVLLWEAYR